MRRVYEQARAQPRGPYVTPLRARGRAVEARPGAAGTLPVAVVIPLHDGEATIARAVRSALGQRPSPPAAVVVVDDGSGDAGAEVAERAGARVIRHERNRGLAAARTTGIRATSEPWLAFLDCDDEWLPHHLATLWAMRDGHDVVAATALCCGSDPRQDYIRGPMRRRPVVLRAPGPLVDPQSFVTVSGAMARREALERAGGFRDRYGGLLEDLDLWCRILERGTGVVSPVVGVLYHLHAAQMSRDVSGMHGAFLALLDDCAARGTISPARVEHCHGGMAWARARIALADGRRRQAVAELAAMVGHPRRLGGALRLAARRLVLRRRSTAVRRDGAPSVALLPGVAAHGDRTPVGTDSRAAVDLRDRGSVQAWITLLRAPAGIAVVRSPLQGVAVRLLGVRPVREGDRLPAGARSTALRRT